MTDFVAEVITEVRGSVGFMTLNRSGALNALNLSMIRALTACLLAWREDDRVQAVAIRGCTKAGPFGALCAGGDIRFFHQALLSGDPAPEDFFTEEYTLNHLIHIYPKPYIAFMDGVVMGGGMGLCQGHALAAPMGEREGAARRAPFASGKGGKVRLVTARSKLAMPETAIGLFPDVGGGYFLSRCPGYAGEWLALTGTTLDASQAIALGLADHVVAVDELPVLWDALAQLDRCDEVAVQTLIATFCAATDAFSSWDRSQIDYYFSLDSVRAIVHALDQDSSDWARHTAEQLRQRSPLMLHVAFEQIRRARQLTLAEDLRMERDMMRHVFSLQHLSRTGAQTEAAEGIRALAIDKDNAPRWQPTRIEDVTPQMVAPFFKSPWVGHSHPLRGLDGVA